MTIYEQPAYLHPELWNPNADPITGIFENLLDQERYPELYKISKFIGNRQYWDMANVNLLDDYRPYWVSTYFAYPSSITSPLSALDTLYATAASVNPEAYHGDAYYDARRIQLFITLVDRQREFCYQFLSAYLYRTKTHQETMYNRLYDEERFEGIISGVWDVARNLWKRMPSL